MSKRPLIYELVDMNGNVLYSSEDKIEAFKTVRQLIANDPSLMLEASFIFRDEYGDPVISFFGNALSELIEDETLYD